MLEAVVNEFAKKAAKAAGSRDERVAVISGSSRQATVQKRQWRRTRACRPPPGTPS